MKAKTIYLCQAGAITTNEFFAITLIGYGITDAINWSKYNPDYPSSSILQYIGNWLGGDAEELMDNISEDILDPLYKKEIMK